MVAGKSSGFNMRARLGFNFYDVFVIGFACIFALICFYPMWYVTIASFTPYDVFIRDKVLLIPTSFDFQYYQAIFKTTIFVRSLGVSVLKTVLATGLSLLVTSSMAYAVSKTHIRGMKLINALVVFNLFFSGGLIPEYMLYKDIGLLRTFWVMVIPGALNITYFIIMRNYFSFTVSPDLEEAARIDGCNDVGIFLRIILPLSKPMLAAVGLFIAVINWNDYYNYMMFIQSESELQPLAWLLRRMLVDPKMMSEMRKGMPNIPPVGLRMTTVVVAMLPILMVYPFLQKHFAQGMMLGAVKE